MLKTLDGVVNSVFSGISASNFALDSGQVPSEYAPSIPSSFSLIDHENPSIDDTIYIRQRLKSIDPHPVIMDTTLKPASIPWNVC